MAGFMNPLGKLSSHEQRYAPYPELLLAVPYRQERPTREQYDRSEWMIREIGTQFSREIIAEFNQVV